MVELAEAENLKELVEVIRADLTERGAEMSLPTLCEPGFALCCWVLHHREKIKPRVQEKPATGGKTGSPDREDDDKRKKLQGQVKQPQLQ